MRLIKFPYIPCTKDKVMNNTTVPTHEMIKNLTEYIVNGMSYQELTQHVYDDVYSIMLEDEDMFHVNLEQLGYKPEDFTNAKFRGNTKETD